MARTRSLAIRRLGPPILTIACLVSFGSGTVAASRQPLTRVAGSDALTRSNPTSWPIFWDSNNNGVADDVGVNVDAEGGAWNAARRTLLTNATNQWKNNTDFDPGRDDAAGYDAFIDGRQPTCGNFTPNVTIARVCVSLQTHYFPQDPTEIKYQRILGANVTFNVTDFFYSFAAGAPPAGDVDFQGIATHELGHWVLLIDLHDGAAGCSHNAAQDTMCGDFASSTDTFNARTLTADDKASANAVYP